MVASWRCSREAKGITQEKLGGLCLLAEKRLGLPSAELQGGAFREVSPEVSLRLLLQ